MNPISDNDDEYLLCLFDCNDEDLIKEELVEVHYGYGKNYDMLHQLILDAGPYYKKVEEEEEEEVPIILEYYFNNLVRVDSLKSFIDDQYNGLLHAAYFLLAGDRIKTEAILRYIACHRNVKFFQENFMSAAGGSNYIFFKLIEGGGNVHYKPSESYCIPLQFIAALGKRTKIMKYILDSTVDVNNCYNCQFYSKALHYALQKNNNMEIIELLIQRGADTIMYSRGGPYDDLTHFEYAIGIKHFNNAAFFLNSKLTANAITFDIIKSGFSRFCRLYSDNHRIFRTILDPFAKPQEVMDYYDFFKLLCENLIKYFIANNNSREPPILSIYFNNRVFESKDWAKALTVLLTSEIASTLLEECLSYEKESIYALLIPQLVWAEVELEDRIELYKLLLSLGMIPNLKDMALILTHFRFNEEFQLLNLHLPNDCLLNDYNQLNHMEYIASVFCGLEDDLDYNRIFDEELREEFYDYIKEYFTPALSNCSLKAYYRNGEMNVIPNILSLQELCRNSARKLIKRSKILSPRDFIFAVNELPIPFKCKNYILLKSKVDELYKN